jgi:hypothetical protein
MGPVLRAEWKPERGTPSRLARLSASVAGLGWQGRAQALQGYTRAEHYTYALQGRSTWWTCVLCWWSRAWQGCARALQGLASRAEREHVHVSVTFTFLNVP